MLLWQYRSALAAGLIASAAMSAGSCGSQAQAPHEAEGKGSPKAENPYVEVVRDFRDGAMSGAIYDAYGHAEYMPDSQRAAIDGFCLVVNDARTAPERLKLNDPGSFSARVMAAARPEARDASMASVRRAVDKFQAIVKPESLNSALVKGYAKACY